MPEENHLIIKIPLPSFLRSKTDNQTNTTTYQKFKQKRGVFIGLSALFLFLFVAFSLVVKSKALVGFDFDMTVKLQQHVPLKLDTFFSFLSFLGDAEGATVLLVIILAFRKKIWAFLAVGLYGAAHVVEIVGKNFLDHPGPPRFMLRSQASNFPQFYVYTKGSYPSGHSLRMIFIAIMACAVIYLSKKLSRNTKLLLYGIVALYAVLMLFSRISLGEHWTTDVIAGSFLGGSFGFLALIFL